MYILNKKERSHAYLSMFSQDANAFLQFLFYVYITRGLTTLKMNIMTEASKLMSEDQFYIRRGPNLKMQFKHAF